MLSSIQYVNLRLKSVLREIIIELMYDISKIL